MINICFDLQDIILMGPRINEYITAGFLDGVHIWIQVGIFVFDTGTSLSNSLNVCSD
jgi:hypothetical protein